MNFLITAHSITSHTTRQFKAVLNSLGWGIHLEWVGGWVGGCGWLCTSTTKLSKCLEICGGVVSAVSNWMGFLYHMWPCYWSYCGSDLTDLTLDFEAVCLSPNFCSVESGWFYFNTECKKRDADGFSKFSLVLCVIPLSCKGATYSV